MPTHLDDIRLYYDVNTPDFQRYGLGSELGVIRRAVWGPGVLQRTAAFRYVDELIASELLALDVDGPLRVFDFGCGLGASLLNLWLRGLSLDAHGFTISALQAESAQRNIAAAGAHDQLRCLEADFLNLPRELAPAHGVFAIESFVHSPSALAFFQAAARHLQPGGLLIVCDDFLTPRAASTQRADEQRLIADFRHGWVAPTVITLEDAKHAAALAGFELQTNQDLTPYLELRRPRDRALTVLGALLGPLPIPGFRWRSLMGGNALRLALMSGLVEHRYVTWRLAL